MSPIKYRARPFSPPLLARNPPPPSLPPPSSSPPAISPRARPVVSLPLLAPLRPDDSWKVKLDKILDKGNLRKSDLDDSCLDALDKLPAESASTVMDRFAEANFDRIKNKTGFLMGIIRRCDPAPRPRALAPPRSSRPNTSMRLSELRSPRAVWRGGDAQGEGRGTCRPPWTDCCLGGGC